MASLLARPLAEPATYMFNFAQGCTSNSWVKGALRPEIEAIARYLPWGEIGRKLGSGSSPVPGVPAAEIPR